MTATEPYNFAFIELFICACLSKYPKLIDELDLDILQDESCLNYAKMIAKLPDKENELTYPIVVARLDGRYAEFGFTEMNVEHIMQSKATSIESLNFKQTRDQLRSSIGVLKQRTGQIRLVQQLDVAKALILRGQEKEGIVIAKSLKFSKTAGLEATLSHMLDCVGETNVFKTGIRNIDANGGMTKGNIISLIGDTGSMKTMISMWMCLKMLQENPTFTCLYFEKEMPVKDIARRLIAYATGIDIPKLMGLNKEEALQLVSGHFIKDENKVMLNALSRFKIISNNMFRNVLDMWEYVDEYKPDIWCLDFMTQLEGMGGDSTDFNLSVMRQANKLKEMCTETDSLGIIINQVAKNTVDRRKCKIPLKTDAEWSGTVQQISAYIFATFHPGYYNLPIPSNYYFLVGHKNRHNSKFDIPLEAIPSQCTFTEPDAIIESQMETWLHNYKRS